MFILWIALTAILTAGTTSMLTWAYLRRNTQQERDELAQDSYVDGYLLGRADGYVAGVRYTKKELDLEGELGMMDNMQEDSQEIQGL